MTQSAPYPVELAYLVARWRYRPGWHAWLEDRLRDGADTHGAEGRGLTLCVLADVQDSYHPEVRRPVVHYRIVPAATFNRDSWRRWVRDQMIDIETHEAMEWLRFAEDDGTEVRPFAPMHGPGDDPYSLVEYATDVQRRTSFRGVVKDEGS
jgi:hypothetical protein